MGYLLRGYNWIRRFRHRCGYGVHSPADFYFITFVVYEQLPYYAYYTLSKLRHSLNPFPHSREKVDKLLLRISNYLRPQYLFEYGTGSGLSTLYMAEGCKPMQIDTYDSSCIDSVSHILDGKQNINYCAHSFDNIDLKPIQQFQKVLFHIGHTDQYERIYESLLPYTNNNSCLIVSQPYADDIKKKWWNQVVSDDRNAVTFDLYDIGIVFFDKNRVKEHRIINFL